MVSICNIKSTMRLILILTFCLILPGCNKIEQGEVMNKSAKEILGNPNYPAISYGGYRERTRDIEPTKDQIKEDILILHAAGFRVIRTYDVHLSLAKNTLEVIRELKLLDKNFEMYVMLGAWIDCLNAWTNKIPNHHIESDQNNEEIDRAVALAKQYPDIVKVLAVGNEAMVRWAASYDVQPNVI